MAIRDILLDILSNYGEAKKTNDFAQNTFINKIKSHYTDDISKIVAKDYGERYKVNASCGNGRWADCPWIAIFDSVVTSSAQYGYYIVYLFDKDMDCVYLSLNQGVTDILNRYKKSAQLVLSDRAKLFRHQLGLPDSYGDELKLKGSSWVSKLYNKGNIIAKRYSKALPDEATLRKDLEEFIDYYQQLSVSDDTESTFETTKFTSVEERKERKLHMIYERASTVSSKVKKHHGYKCKVCGLKFSDQYGDIGHNYIEAHHLIPFSSLKDGKTKLDIKKDFTVLCSNCHRMIHKFKDPSNLEEFKSYYEKYKSSKR